MNKFLARPLLSGLFALLTALMMTGCNEVDSSRIPAYRVQIVFNAGQWDSFGVFGLGEHREFIRETRTPSNFAFTETTFTGFGGVLLFYGMDPFTGEGRPLAYDLACPVECKPDIRVVVDDNTLNAVCPVCGSHYNIYMSGGVATEGPAATYRYQLRNYVVVPYNTGYIIK